MAALRLIAEPSLPEMFISAFDPKENLAPMLTPMAQAASESNLQSKPPPKLVRKLE
jgi:hypothetical protein